MIIELCGLPGAGKTHLAKKIAVERGYYIPKVRSRFRLVWFNFIFFLTHPIISKKLWWRIRSELHGKLGYYKFMNFYCNLNARYIAAERADKAVLDQGYAQNILSVFDRKLSEGEIRKYIASIPHLDLIVIVDTPEDIRSQRTSERGYVARERFGPEYVAKWQNVVVENYKTLCALLRTLPIKSAIIKNEEDANQLIASLS